MTPSIELNELVVGVRFPQWAPKHGYAFVEFARRHGDFAITSAAVAHRGRCGGQDHTRLGHHRRHGHGAESARARSRQAIIGQVPAGNLFRDACESCRKLEAIDDIHAPASYRQHLAAVLSRRALEKAYARLSGTETAQARPH